MIYVRAIPTNKGLITTGSEYILTQKIKEHSKDVFSDKNKPVKNEKQRIIYQRYKEYGLAGIGSILSLIGPVSGAPRHFFNNPGLIDLAGGKQIIVAEICYTVYLELLKYINNLQRDDILIGCGDFYDVLNAFYQENHINNKISFLDLDFCSASNSLIKTVHILKKLENIFSGPNISNTFALTLTYSVRGSSQEYHDKLYIQIQYIAKKYNFRISDKSCYKEDHYHDINSDGKQCAKMRTIFGIFVKDRYTRQFNGFFRYGESFIIP